MTRQAEAADVRDQTVWAQTQDSRAPYIRDAAFTIRIHALPTETLNNLAGFLESEGEASPPLSSFAESLAIWRTSPLVRAAINHAAPDLAANLGRIDQLTEDRRHRALLACTRYISRMASRSTPFGLMSAVSRGFEADTTNLVLSKNSIGRISIRPDASSGHRRTPTDAEFVLRPSDVLVRNDLAFVQRNRVWLHTADYYGLGSRATSSVRATAAVRLILRLADRPHGITYEDLVAEMAHAYTETPIATIESLASRLVETQHILLLSGSLTAGSADGDCAQLEELQAEAEFDRKTRIIDNPDLHLLESYVVSANARSLSDSGDVDKSSRSFLHIDSSARFTADSPTLAAPQLDQMAQLANALLRLSVDTGYPSYLRRYAAAFETKYGANARVPLLELLAEDATGLGPPDGYYNPPRQSELNVQPTAPKATVTPRDRLLHKFVRGSGDRVAITLSDLESLEHASKPTSEARPLPFSLDFHATLWRDRDGETWACPTDTGFAYGHRTTARFETLLGSSYSKELADFVRKEEAHDARDEVSAELLYTPSDVRAANVGVNSVHSQFIIPINVETSTMSSSCRISLDDLTVGADRGRLVIWSQRLQKRVRVVQHSMLNSVNAPNPARFLLDVTNSMAQPVSVFDWGLLSDLNGGSTPRLEIPEARLILAPARWQLTKQDLPEKFVLKNKNDREMREQVAESILPDLFVKYKIPQHFHLTEGDNFLDIDTSLAHHRMHLSRSLLKGGRLDIRESLSCEMKPFVSSEDGGHYAAEFVITLTDSIDRRDELLSHSVRPHRDLTNAPRILSIRDGWVYVKVYLEIDAQDDLIKNQLKFAIDSLAAPAQCEHWFFIRYSDPEPHLRIRFKVGSQVKAVSLLGGLADVCNSWLIEGIIRDFTFDTYKPEYDRYGGVRILEKMEHFFSEDSKLLQQSLMHVGLDSGIKSKNILCSVNLFMLMRVLTESEEHARALVSLVEDKKLGGPEYRRDRPALLARVDSQELMSDINSWLCSAANVFAMLRSIDELATAHYDDVVRSVMHMHCNRAGFDRSGEQAIYGIVRRMIDSWNHVSAESWKVSPQLHEVACE